MSAKKKKLKENPFGDAIKREMRREFGEEFQRLFKRPIDDVFYENGWDLGKFDKVIEWREGISTLDRLDELGPEFRALFDGMNELDNKMLTYLGSLGPLGG